MTYTPLREVSKKIRNLEDFNGNSVSGKAYPGGIGYQPDWGRASAGPGRDAVYIVWSYATPVLWVDGVGKVHRTKEKFSVTTSKHMSSMWGLEELTFRQRREFLAMYVIREPVEIEDVLT